MPVSIGRIYQDRGGRWFIRLKDRNKIFCDKQHESFYSMQHAQATLIKIGAEMEAGTFDVSFYQKRGKNLLSFESYAKQWLANCERRLVKGELKPSYLKELRRFINKIFIPHFGNQSLLEIRGFHIKQFYLSLDVHPKTCSNIMGALHKIFCDAVDDEFIQAVPNFPKIKNIPEPNWSHATVEEQDEIMAHLEDQSYYAIYFLACHGVRPGELRALRHSDIDLKNDKITIARAVSHNMIMDTTKTYRRRVILLDPAWKELYLERPRTLDREALVFTKDGKMLSETWLGKCWRKACDEAGVERIKLYDATRHSLASQAINDGVELYHIQRQLGHTTSRMTQRYAHLETKSLLDVRRKSAVRKVSAT